MIRTESDILYEVFSCERIFTGPDALGEIVYFDDILESIDDEENNDVVEALHENLELLNQYSERIDNLYWYPQEGSLQEANAGIQHFRVLRLLAQWLLKNISLTKGDRFVIGYHMKISSVIDLILIIDIIVNHLSDAAQSQQDDRHVQNRLPFTRLHSSLPCSSVPLLLSTVFTVVNWSEDIETIKFEAFQSRSAEYFRHRYNGTARTYTDVVIVYRGDYNEFMAISTNTGQVCTDPQECMMYLMEVQSEYREEYSHWWIADGWDTINFIYKNADHVRFLRTGAERMPLKREDFVGSRETMTIFQLIEAIVNIPPSFKRVHYYVSDQTDIALLSLSFIKPCDSKYRLPAFTRIDYNEKKKLQRAVYWAAGRLSLTIDERIWVLDTFGGNASNIFTLLDNLMKKYISSQSDEKKYKVAQGSPNRRFHY